MDLHAVLTNSEAVRYLLRNNHLNPFDSAMPEEATQHAREALPIPLKIHVPLLES